MRPLPAIVELRGAWGSAPRALVAGAGQGENGSICCPPSEPLWLGRTQVRHLLQRFQERFRLQYHGVHQAQGRKAVASSR